jgi:hypothetical protein
MIERVDLIDPGSSLGGARPKASVTYDKGHLWIAKFPISRDEKNAGAWEMVSLFAKNANNFSNGIQS